MSMLTHPNKGKAPGVGGEIYNQVRVFEILTQGSFLREQMRVYI